LCAWTQATGGTPPTFGTDVRIFVRDAPNVPTCAGTERAGEFGWLNGHRRLHGPDRHYAERHHRRATTPARASPRRVRTRFDVVRRERRTDLHSRSSTRPPGAGSGLRTYHLVGLAAFILTGYANMNPLKDAIPAPFTQE
jgi:hypothetical protein